MVVTPATLKEWQVKFNEALAEKDARVFDRTETVYASLVGDAELWRHWPELSPKDIPLACEYLNLVTSVKNKTACQYVDEPMAGDDVFPGRWRQAYVRRIQQGDVVKLVQVLRRGFAEEIKWDEARLVEGRDLRESEHYRTLRWQNLSPKKVHQLAISLNDSVYKDKLISGERLEGEWHNIYVQPSIAEDGSGVVTMLLAKPEFVLEAYSSYGVPNGRDVTYIWQVPKDYAQGIINANRGTGNSCTANYGNASGLVDLIIYRKDFSGAVSLTGVLTLWSCRYREFTDYHLGISKADMEGYLAKAKGGDGDDSTDIVKYSTGDSITQRVDGEEWTYRISDNGDGSWDVIIAKRKSQSRSVDAYTTEVSAAGTTTQEHELGTTAATAALESESGKIKRRRIEHRDDCSKDITLEEITPTNQQAIAVDTSKSSYAARISNTENPNQGGPVYEIDPSGAGTRIISFASGLVLGEPFDAVSLGLCPDMADGDFVVSTEYTDYVFAKYSIASRNMEIVRHSSTSPFVSGYEYTLLYRFGVVKGADGKFVVRCREAYVTAGVTSANRGRIITRLASPKPSGNYATDERTVVPREQAAVSYLESKARRVIRKTYLEKQTDLQYVLAGSSGSYKVRVYGTFRGVKLGGAAGYAEATVSAATQAEIEKQREGFVFGWQSTTDPTSMGITVDSTADKRDSGKVYYLLCRILVPVDGLSGSIVFEAYPGEMVARSASELTGLPIRRIDARPTQAGNQEVVEELIQPLDQDGLADRKTNFENASTETHTEGSSTDAPVESFSPGEIKEVDRVPTEGGKFRTRKTTRSANKVKEYNAGVIKGDLETVTITRGHNYSTTEAENLAEPAVGSLDKQQNEFRCVDWIKRTKTVNEDVTTTAVSWTTTGQVYYVFLFRTLQEPVPGVFQYIYSYQGYRTTREHTLGFKESAESAARALVGGSHGSGISRVSDFLWQYHKIVESEVPYGGIKTVRVPVSS